MRQQTSPAEVERRRALAVIFAQPQDALPLMEKAYAAANPDARLVYANILALFGNKTGADTLVCEMMSIGAECLAVESRRILRPGTLALTNVRLDHLEEMGRRKEEIARTLASAFPERAAIFIPEEEIYPVFEKTAARTGSKIHAVVREECAA
jgi:hypothetical protein